MLQSNPKGAGIMFGLFDKERTASIFVERSDEAIMLAVSDLVRNLRDLAGRNDGFELAENGTIRILTKAGESESYSVEITDSEVAVTGGDTLGTVFGIYAFATKILGITPTYRLTDLFPTPRAKMELEPTVFKSPERKIKFRGWFLNDEDLLTEFKESGGVRHIDYRWYNTTMHGDVLDMIIETALRMEINLMIPSSFVDIDNPDEEKLVEAVYRRGMYITQHHIEPLGVSYFGALGYMKKQGIDGEVSFISNRAAMEEIWTHYAQKWAKYKDRVIWQFGLRGRADEAVWKRDINAPTSNEGRGALISDAIQTQYDIVKKTLGGEKFISTSTFWLEGARLYGLGHLKLPEDTIAIFSDIGLDQMFGDDFYSVPRLEGRKYGIYYHVAFFSRGPHLADTCNPLKMEFSYKEAAKMNSLTYSMVNVSNVRPLHYSVSANAELMNNPTEFDYREFSKAFHKAHFGDAASEVMRLRDKFYLSCGNIGEKVLKTLCDQADFYYHDYGKLPFVRYTFDDGDIYMAGRWILKGITKNIDIIRTYRQELLASAERFEKLLDELRKCEKNIPAESIGYYRTFLVYQTEYMMLSSRWSACCIEMNDMNRSQRGEIGKRALSYVERIIELRKIEARGKWEGWHNGDKKFNLPECVELTKGFFD